MNMLSGFQFLPIMNNTAMNIHIELTLEQHMMQGLGAPTLLTVESLSIIYSWPSTRLLCIWVSAYVDSTNCGSCSTVVFTIEKNPKEFKFVLFKGQLYKLLCEHVFIPLLYIPKSRIAGSYGNSVFNPMRNCQTVFTKWLHHFPAPPAMNEGSSFSTPSETLVNVCLWS